MTLAGWLIVAALATVVAWLGLALIGVVREQSALRARVEGLESASTPTRLDAGLAVGRRAPDWSIAAPSGDVVTSSSVAGERHLLVFADADCSACESLVPNVVQASAEGILPPVVIIGRGNAAATPSSWRNATSGVERDGEVSAAFDVDVSPHVFVVDDGGVVVAQGVVVDLHDVEVLVAAGRGITIVDDADV
jgi:hypothetical protein